MPNENKSKTYSTTLHSASKSKYFKKRIFIKAIVNGKTLTPYYVPKKVRVICKRKRACGNCIILKDDKLKIDFMNVNFVKLIGVSDARVPIVIKEMFDLSKKCDIKIDPIEAYTVEEIFLSPLISAKNTSHVSRTGYVIGHGIACNIPYLFECYNVPEPRQQKLVHIIFDSEKLKTDIDSFSLSKQAKKDLKIFNPKENTAESIFEKLEEIYEIYACNITKIYYRFDLHMALDLVFHSPLSFYFNNEYVHKGWSDIMILGDTRCGKGYVAENLCRYYGVGDIVSGENLSFAGLVGGTQQLNGKWVVTWGKIPLNDRHLVIIDEAGEMDDKDFSRLSRVRSEGIAEITKIQSEKVRTRTRLAFLANPSNRTIASYTYGIEALIDVIKNPEDISRFDYVLIVANDEVSIDKINTPHKEVSNPYKDFDQQLILWCWSRTQKQIKFTSEAVKLALKLSIKLGGMYISEIPLIQGENIRVKLAKIAVSIAARLFSTDDKGENIIVNKKHIESAYLFLNMIYKKRCSSYYFYSQVKKEPETIVEIDKLNHYFKTFDCRFELIDYFIHNNYVTLTDLSEHVNQPKEIAREVISQLLKYKCIKKKYTFYIKNQSFINWLRKQARIIGN